MSGMSDPDARVLFFIGCFRGNNSGSGGHYYSLLTMAKALGTPYTIVVIGDFFPPALSGQPSVEFFDVGAAGVLSFHPRVLSHLGKPRIVHAYDFRSTIYASKTASFFGVPLVVTKPGGPPLKAWSMTCRNMVVFHDEDYAALSGRRFFKPQRFVKIGHRVKAGEDVSLRRKNPFSCCDDTDLKLLRIARIGSAYIQSVYQSIALLDRLQSDGHKAFLAIVGRIENSQIHEQLQRHVAGRHDVALYTSDEFTVQAAELVPYADAVIGTGRGLMEAMAEGKFSFFPLSDAELPCFLKEDTYQSAMYRNFSPRLSLADGFDPEQSYQAFLALYQSADQSRHTAWLKESFRQNHDVQTGARLLLEFYAGAKTPESRFSYARRLVGWSLLRLQSWLSAKVR